MNWYISLKKNIVFSALSAPDKRFNIFQITMGNGVGTRECSNQYLHHSSFTLNDDVIIYRLI